MKIKLLFLSATLFYLNNGIAQNQTINNVAIGTDGPAYGATIKANFPAINGGWARGYSISNESGNIPFINFGCLGTITNGVATVSNSFIGKDFANQYMTFLPSGNIGIGTTTPAEKVQVTGGNISIRTDANGTWGSFRLGCTNVSYLDAWAGLESDNEVIGTNVANLKFYTSYGSRSEKMRVTASGNVGIGTTSPTSKLDVIGTGAEVSLNANSPATANFRIAGHIQLAINTSVTAPYTTSLQSKHSIADGTPFPIALNPLGGNVGIGTTTPDQKLTVNGTIHSKEVIVDTNFTPDYVFQKYYTGKSELKSDYAMPTLAEIENFTKENHHLPNVPSAQEIQQNGLPLGEMSNVLLQKIEELTLYAIEQNKVIEELKVQVATLMAKKQ